MEIDTETRSSSRLISPSLQVIIGLTIAQVIGTFHVGWSNRMLFNRMKAVIEAGYLAIPGDGIKPGLLSVKAAIGGGLFFTLTIGAFITLLSIGWFTLCQNHWRLRKWCLGLAAAMVIGGLVLLNSNGFNLFASLYLLLIPLFIYLSGGLVKEVTPIRKHSFLNISALVCPPVLLVVLGGFFLDQHAFIDARDHLLLSNSPGRVLNDYYYRHTLYPAESIKALSRKQIRTVYLDKLDDFVSKTDITRILETRDYLFVASGNHADVVIQSATPAMLILKTNRKKVQQTATDFFPQVEETLQRLSNISDHNRWFRKMIYIALIIGFPLLVYLIIFGLTRKLLAWVFSNRWSVIGASIVCMGLGLLFIWVLTAEQSFPPTQRDILDLTGSPNLRKRVMALKMMENKKLDPSQYPAYKEILKSEHISERYWLARALGHGKENQTYHDLIRLLDDPSPNVVCVALWSLGKRRNRLAVPVIMDRMKHWNHWYVQWYAYNALKNLKWRQHGLN